MDQDHLRGLLEQVRAGAVDVDAAMERMRHLPFEDLGFAKVDHHRALRHGIPEVVFGKGKTPDQISAIAASLLDKAQNVLVTRADPPTAERLQREHPQAEYFPPPAPCASGATAPCAAKARSPWSAPAPATCPWPRKRRSPRKSWATKSIAIHDIGVAGIHRLMQNRERLSEARVVIVCAGMEGALPSVVGGLVAAPVIAVPTSVGYGASFQGLAALLGMLNSCASNVTVVNIDNGFGAGYAASLMNRL